MAFHVFDCGFSYKYIQMTAYKRRALQTWLVPDRCQEKRHYLEISKSLQILLMQVGYIPLLCS